MKRKIKFKAWDEEKRIMLQPVTSDLVIHLCGKQNSLDNEGDLNGTEYTKQLTLLQFTGLCDRNGYYKEIYEGDICDTHTRFGRGVVIFENGVFKINGISLCSFDKIEVIGNIYENPELLETEE